jgi:iron complex transport system substrate-binding protein
MRRVLLRRLRVGATWLGVLVLAHGLGAGSARADMVVRDDRGRDVRLPAPPLRIVSLLPSLTESVCALKACERLVGTDRYSNWPASVRALPKLGGIEDLPIELLVKLRPDVVLAAKSHRLLDRLDALGVPVVALEAQSHADVQRTLGVLGRLLGQPAAAEQAWRDIEADIERAAARVPPALRGKAVYFEVGSAPYAAGPVSFIGQTLARLGLGNALPAELGPFPKLNPEYVVRARPDIVMLVAREARGLQDRPGWAALEALKRRQVCAFETPQWELLIRPGPRMGEAAIAIADCLARLSTAGER